MNKQEYRDYFIKVSKYLKIAKSLPNKISPVNMSRFMKSNEYDYVFSLETLKAIYTNIQNILKNLID